MKDLDDRLWSRGDQTISAIPIQRDHITMQGSRPALGQIKDEARSVLGMLKGSVSTHLPSFDMLPLP